jgi:hypothetical protein
MTGDKFRAPRPDLRMRRRDHQERVNRARGRLAEILSIEDASDLGADRATRTVVNSSLSGLAPPLISPAQRYLVFFSNPESIRTARAIWLQ